MDIPFGMRAVPAMLFVRSTSDLDLALQQINPFLAFRQNRSRARGYDQVLAICFRRDLDARVPAPVLSIRHSLSSAGIWSLSSLSDPPPGDSGSRPPQREAIFRALLKRTREWDPPASLHPVFAPEESPEAVAAEVRRLKEHHPQLAELILFRQDSSLGIYREWFTGRQNPNGRAAASAVISPAVQNGRHHRS